MSTAVQARWELQVASRRFWQPVLLHDEKLVNKVFLKLPGLLLVAINERAAARAQT
jgi:hypothetical protein